MFCTIDFNVFLIICIVVFSWRNRILERVAHLGTDSIVVAVLKYINVNRTKRNGLPLLRKRLVAIATKIEKKTTLLVQGLRNIREPIDSEMPSILI